jgi:hypothetical protein
MRRGAVSFYGSEVDHESTRHRTRGENMPLYMETDHLGGAVPADTATIHREAHGPVTTHEAEEGSR